MNADEDDLPRDERLEFDTPILSAPAPASAVIRKAFAGERVTVTAFTAGFAQVAVSRRRAGYVRQDAVGVPLPASEPASTVPASSRSASIARSGSIATGSSTYPGAVFVANLLWIVALLVFIGGAAAGLAYASSYDAVSSDHATAVKVGIFLGATVYGLVVALLVWAVGYILLLLNRIELNTR